MTRDIRDRLTLMSGVRVEVRRIALTMDQIDELKPPPNPAKSTDSRFKAYQKKYGNVSWELDALPPTVLSKLAEDEILSCIEPKAWKKWATGVDKARAKMLKLVEGYKD